jgi:type IV pilus assembly protein PilE
MRPTSQRHAPAGFTLIELLVAVAVVAILSAIAVPAYTDYVRRAHVADAQKALASSATDLEQIFADRRSYPLAADFTQQTTTKFGYTYAPTADRRGYVLAADGQANLDGYHLALTSAEAKCKCERCGSNPLTGVAATAAVCPAGSVPW